MPYTIANPPEAVKGLPRQAQEIFIAAYNAAFTEYKGDEAKSSATAWAAVKTKYEKTDDKWVAKESKSMTIISDIIQEAGKRGKANDPKIQKLVTLSEPTETELVEATSVLAWLKEQAAMKTEEGVEYPAAAFAYVADAGKPADWKLRIWEDPDKKVTKAQLGRIAAALSPGGYKGKKVDIASADLPAVKRKIRAAYRALEVEEDDIPRWVRESEARTLLSDYIPLTEAKIGSKGKAVVTVIKPGFNSSKDRYYPAEMLARDYPVFEGVKMYSDHPTEKDEKERPERSIRDWVATLQNVRPGTDGTIVGEAVIVEPWMQEKLSTLRDNSMLKDMGISINAIGSASKAEIEGVKTNFIERIVRARSVDFVTEAGAGGGVQLYESDNADLDVDLISMDTLKERRPDLIKAIESAVKTEINTEVKKKMALEDDVKTLTETNQTLTKELDEVKGKLAEADKAKAKADAQAIIKEAIAKAELPDAAKERLSEQFKEADKADGVTEAIKTESDYIAKLAESGKVKNLGGSKLDTEADKKALKESFKRLGLTDKGADIAVAGR